MTEQKHRQLESVVKGHATSDGAGVSLTRFLYGAKLQRRLDPFLMLDAFGSDDPQEYIAGFPDHPHRGFETITYMLEGCMRHEDSAGNQGLLNSGDLQWMCAGSGVVHSELPQQIEGRMEGFQLWLNLPAADKMCQPWYRDIAGDSVPEVELENGTRIRVVAGEAFAVSGAMQRPVTQPLYLDVQLPAGASLVHEVAQTHNAFVQLYRGELEIGQQLLQAPALGILDNQAGSVCVRAVNASRYLLVAGKPLNEPIEQYGPFVMNTKEEIYQAVQDMRAGRIG